MRDKHRRLLLACGLAGWLTSPFAQAQASAALPSSAFDGRWVTTLVCEDLRDRETFVKGYIFNFFVDVKEGRLTGQYGEVGQSSSLTMTGTIQPDGTVEIDACGRTGDPQYTVGRVMKSTPYAYQMRGTFTSTAGRAARIELRPCQATFVKQQRP